MNTSTASSTILTISLGTDAPRVTRMLSHVPTVAFLNAIATAEQVSKMNQKGALRLVESCAFAVSGDAKSFDKGTAMLTAAIALTQQPRLVFDDLKFLMGMGVDGASHIAGVSRAKMHKFIGRVGAAGTIRSKLSRTVANRGIFGALGITSKGDAHSCELTDTAKRHPLVIAYAAQLEKMTDGTFEVLYREQ